MLFRQSFGRSSRFQFKELGQESDLRLLIANQCSKNPSIFNALFNTLVEANPSKFIEQILPELTFEQSLRQLKSRFQGFGISDESFKDYLRPKESHVKPKDRERLRYLAMDAIPVIKRNEFYKTLLELDEEGEIKYFEEFNLKVPHYKPSVALEILKRMNVLVQD